MNINPHNRSHYTGTAARDWLRRLGSEKDIEDLLCEAEKQSESAQEESDPSVKAEMLEKALIMLRDKVSPMIRLKVKPVLDELMNSVEKEAADAVDRLWKMRHESKRDETKQVTLFYPHGEGSKFRIGSPVVVKYDDDELYITTGHVLKLRSLYVLRMRRDKKESAKGIEDDKSVEYVILFVFENIISCNPHSLTTPTNAGTHRRDFWMHCINSYDDTPHSLRKQVKCKQQHLKMSSRQCVRILVCVWNPSDHL